VCVFVCVCVCVCVWMCVCLNVCACLRERECIRESKTEKESACATVAWHVAHLSAIYAAHLSAIHVYVPAIHFTPISVPRRARVQVSGPVRFPFPAFHQLKLQVDELKRMTGVSRVWPEIRQRSRYVNNLDTSNISSIPRMRWCKW